MCVYDMAQEFLELIGSDPHESGPIRITELTEGEKVHERLHSADESLEPTRSPRILRVSPTGTSEPAWSVDDLLTRARLAVTNPSLSADLLHEVCCPPTVPNRPAALQMTGE